MRDRKLTSATEVLILYTMLSVLSSIFHYMYFTHNRGADNYAAKNLPDKYLRATAVSWPIHRLATFHQFARLVSGANICCTRFQ